MKIMFKTGFWGHIITFIKLFKPNARDTGYNNQKTCLIMCIKIQFGIPHDQKSAITNFF